MADEKSTDGDGEASGEGRDIDRCLSFTVKGPWGHFRRIEGNIVKQTYRVIPRTTVAGLVAGVLGIGRDEYYHLFAPGSSAIAIEPKSELRTLNMPMNTLSTAGESMKTLNSRGSLSIGFPDSTDNRQQHNYEVLVDPAYRIDLWLEDQRVYGELQEMLSQGRSHYTPSLGLSEHLAEVEYHGEFDVESVVSEGTAKVDSTVPTDDVVPDPGTEFRMEKPPAFMERHEGGRRTTAFTSYSYNPEAEPLKIKTDNVPVNEVDSRQVVFV